MHLSNTCSLILQVITFLCKDVSIILNDIKEREFSLCLSIYSGMVMVKSIRIIQLLCGEMLKAWADEFDKGLELVTWHTFTT